ncbi:uncharacterized protein LOC116205706 [Punica granatum]|uniref:Uncharacterized protein LOC116205706 n=2 Tax=Punica granatum TaxID=22663 RepID=A0A6P8DLA8_PUNGR|nr:uncharacterized protein LOC116205706 [Punica granatum]PKI78683.1 hypothetical protein CRG98_000908 [Punica granatum]
MARSHRKKRSFAHFGAIYLKRAASSLLALGATILLDTTIITIVHSMSNYGLGLMKQTEGLFWEKRPGALMICFGSNVLSYSIALTFFLAATMLYKYVSRLSLKAIEKKFSLPLWIWRTVALYLISELKGEVENNRSSSEVEVAQFQQHRTCELKRECSKDDNKESLSGLGDCIEEEEERSKEELVRMTMAHRCIEEKSHALNGRLDRIIELSTKCRRTLNEEPRSKPHGSDCCSSCREKDELIRTLQNRNYNLDTALEKEELTTEILSAHLHAFKRRNTDLLARTHPCCCHEKDEAIWALEENNAHLRELLVLIQDSSMVEFLHQSEEQDELIAKLESAQAKCEFYRSCIDEMVQGR